MFIKYIPEVFQVLLDHSKMGPKQLNRTEVMSTDDPWMDYFQYALDFE